MEVNVRTATTTPITCPLCERGTKVLQNGRIKRHFANGRNICSLSGRRIELLVTIR